MSIFTYQENPAGEFSFQKKGDFYAIDSENNIMAVADSPLRLLTKNQKDYPLNDLGSNAASTFCNKFVEYAQKSLVDKTINKSTLKKIFLKINKDIYELNTSLGKTYNNKDKYNFAETVGMGAVIFDGKLFYGGLEDCYVNILRGEDLTDVATINYQITKSFRYLKSLDENQKNKLAPKYSGDLDLQMEYLWCTYLRNNPKITNDSKEILGWGCFTGEEKVEEFIQVHEIELKKGDHILLFSDGMIPSLSSNQFLHWFLENVKPTFEFQKQMRSKIIEMFKDHSSLDKEKTLIYLKY